MKTLCLVMIVRNESKIIRRCLEQFKDHISYWVIVDTGSDDGTQSIILDTLKGIPGELHEREWINFGVNRSQSLQLAKGKADYLLLCDADEKIIFSDDFDTCSLHKDAYLISYTGNIDYSVPYLIKGDLNWHYVGVTHEYLDCDRPTEREKIDTISIVDCKDGGFKSDKFERDIRLLEQGLLDEPNNSRYKFYLANSYRDIGNYEKATEWYLKRIEDGGWIEEVTCSYIGLGTCYSSLGNKSQAVYYWLLGYSYNPTRAESLYYAIHSLRSDEKYQLAHQLALLARKIDYPNDNVLFIERNIYSYLIDYELSITSFYVGELELGYECCVKVLQNSFDNTINDITLDNLRFYQQVAKEKTKDHVNSLVKLLKDRYSNNQKAKDRIMFLSSIVNIPNTYSKFQYEPVQMLWIGKEISRLEHLCMQSYLSNDHPVHLYTYGDVVNLPQGIEVFDANDIIPEKNIFVHWGSYAAFADLFRWKLLSEKGGYYSDTDIICVKPLDFPDDVVIGWETEDLISPALMKFPKQHPLVLEMLDSALNPNVIRPYDDENTILSKQKKSQENDNSPMGWGETAGPIAVTKVYRYLLEHNLIEHFYPKSISAFYSINWKNWQDIFVNDKNESSMSTDVYALHLWNQALNVNGFDKRLPFGVNTLVGMFFSKYCPFYQE